MNNDLDDEFDAEVDAALLMIKTKFSRLSFKKAASLMSVSLLLILFPTYAIQLAYGLLEIVGVIIGVIYARYWGIFDYMPEGCSASGIDDDYCDDDRRYSDDSEKYQHEVDLGFH